MIVRSYMNLVGGLEHVLLFHILIMSSSQLTVSHIFQRGGSTTNQVNTIVVSYVNIINHCKSNLITIRLVAI